MFWVDLKACLGLVLPNQYYVIVKIEAGFWVMLFRGPCLLLCGPYYTVLSYCMISALAARRQDESHRVPKYQH